MTVDGISLEVFKHLFSSVAEEMGLALQRASFSPNIRERLDFSCAVFDEAGRMVAQAAHIPVHLGSMPASVEYALRHFDQPESGRYRHPERPLSRRHAFARYHHGFAGLRRR